MRSRRSVPRAPARSRPARSARPESERHATRVIRRQRSEWVAAHSKARLAALANLLRRVGLTGALRERHALASRDRLDVAETNIDARDAAHGRFACVVRRQARA